LVNSTKKLFLTQSALSHQLKELEEGLGFKVFLRKRQQWELTEEGTEFYKLSIEVLEQMEKGLKKIEKIRTGSVGDINVGTECYSFYQGLSGFVQKMGVLYPKIKVDLRFGSTYNPIKNLVAEDIDIAIVTTKPEDDSLTCIEIFNDEIFALMHHENPLNQLPYLEAEHFEDAPIIIHSFPLETVSIHCHYLSHHNITPKNISAFPLTEVALEMVSANMGIFCVPRWKIKSFKLSENIVFKQIGNQGVKRTHYLVIRKVDAHKKYIKDFICNFKEDFSEKKYLTNADFFDNKKAESSWSALEN
jgi:LysR family transcriptional regulator for metE and metH